MRCGQSFGGAVRLLRTIRFGSGKAARPAPEEDKDTKGVQEFNRMVYKSKELYPASIPLRDGLTICRKS